jgi:NADH-quinone oxidoreductase subunit J
MLELLTPIRIIFYLFSIMAIVSSIFVITAKNPVRSVLSLVVTFFAMAGVWMILHAEFLALILLLVYIGAVMTLFLFVIMMLNIDIEYQKKAYVRYLPFGLMMVALLAIMLMMTFYKHQFLLTSNFALLENDEVSNVAALGYLLFTQYAYPFEVAGVLLLVAIIAAITLAHRKPHKRKSQGVSEQIAVRAEDRVRLIKMPAEPKQGDNNANA